MAWRDYLSDAALEPFLPIEIKGTRVLVRRGYERWPELLGQPGRAPMRFVGGGRAEHPLIELPTGEHVLLRAYRRGGLMRHLNRDRYLFGHRAFDELRATERARLAGVRAPVVLSAVERPAAVGYTAVLATLWIEGATALADVLASPGRWAVAEPVLVETGRQMGRMHAAGIAHPDLNLNNLLLTPAETPRGRSRGPGIAPGSSVLDVHLLDFDRARVRRAVPPARRARDLRRLARSARKHGVPFGPAEWGALRAGYGPDWPAGV